MLDSMIHLEAEKRKPKSYRFRPQDFGLRRKFYDL